MVEPNDLGYPIGRRRRESTPPCRVRQRIDDDGEVRDEEGVAQRDYPLLQDKDYGAPSLFLPANLLREARRQQNRSNEAVPAVALLDPDGDIVSSLSASGRGRRHLGWSCYHTSMWVTDLDGVEVGVVGSAVGSSFAVLVAEQLAASGARLVVSITSAGQISPVAQLPCFVLIDRALRDEGTSAHYQPPARWSHLDPALQARLRGAFEHLAEPVLTGPSWTTDAPYRETRSAIAAAERDHVVCVEMEAAALYAYAAARGQQVVCLAHMTNVMGTADGDFDKGLDNGVHDALAVCRAVASSVEP